MANGETPTPELLERIAKTIADAVPVAILAILAWAGRAAVKVARKFFNRLDVLEEKLEQLERHHGEDKEERRVDRDQRRP